MKPEYVVWGVPPGGDDEVPLFTRATTEQEARLAAAALADRHGCTALRVQIVRMDELPDFAGAIVGPRP